MLHFRFLSVVFVPTPRSGPLRPGRSFRLVLVSLRRFVLAGRVVPSPSLFVLAGRVIPSPSRFVLAGRFVPSPSRFVLTGRFVLARRVVAARHPGCVPSHVVLLVRRAQNPLRQEAPPVVRAPQLRLQRHLVDKVAIFEQTL